MKLELEPDQLMKFKSGAANTGVVTCNRQKTVTLVDMDGKLLMAGDIKPGQVLLVNTETGVTQIIK